MGFWTQEDREGREGGSASDDPGKDLHNKALLRSRASSLKYNKVSE
jgi:hypothetical protein